MAQYQAGYILESVRESLKTYAKKHKKDAALHGLLRSLSTFNVQTNLNLETPSNLPSILAVAYNILTRGLPTLASIYMEDHFSNAFSLSYRLNDIPTGKINFPLAQNKTTKNANEEFFKSLHVIEPRARNRFEYLNISNVDSSFEHNFLLQLVPDKYSYLTQLLEKQRIRSSFTRDNNSGRVDFSLEIPYDLSRSRTNRYNNQVQIKHHKTYIVEVDGINYHTELVDDLKDFEIAQLSHNISHITEDRVHQDVNDFLQCISEEDYVKVVEENYINKTYLTNPLTAMALSPFGVARLQRILIQYLIANYDTIIQQATIKIAIVERDFPCGHVALTDLMELLHTLNGLSQTQIALPQFNLEVFSTTEFINHPLHGEKRAAPLSTLNTANFNLVLDVSLLQREGIFKEVSQTAVNSILIRNSHFTHYKTETGVISAHAIVYRSLVNQLQNEVYEPIEETSALLKKKYFKTYFGNSISEMVSYQYWIGPSNLNL